MKKLCRRFEERLEANIPEADPAWQDHLAKCAECSEQVTAHQLLDGLALEAVPELSGNFTARLNRRIDAEARSRASHKLRSFDRWLLAGYGVTASVVSVAIVATVPWHEVAVPLGLRLAFGGVLLMSPLFVLDRLSAMLAPT